MSTHIERQRGALELRGVENPLFFWLKTAFFAFLVFFVCLGYVFVSSGKAEIFQINQAAANAGTILISLSFLLSSLSYFFDLFDRYIIYRKHLGIVGFAYIVAHILFVTLMMPWLFRASDWLGTRIVPFLYGLSATIIFLAMTAVSNKYAVTTLGGVRWRAFLRYGGYLALLLSLGHIWFSSARYWQVLSLWPLSMVAFIFGVVTIIFRVMMGLNVWSKRS